MVDFMTPLSFCLGLEGSAQSVTGIPEEGLPVMHDHSLLGAAAQPWRTAGDSRPSERLAILVPASSSTPTRKPEPFFESS